jgi:hypothetical protein
MMQGEVTRDSLRLSALAPLPPPSPRVRGARDRVGGVVEGKKELDRKVEEMCRAQEQMLHAFQNVQVGLRCVRHASVGLAHHNIEVTSSVMTVRRYG